MLTTTRRRFLQLVGLGSAAVGLGMELLRPEGEKRIWQVSRSAPVRDLAREFNVGEAGGEGQRAAWYYHGLAGARLRMEEGRRIGGGLILSEAHETTPQSPEREMELYRSYRTYKRNAAEGRGPSNEAILEQARSIRAGNERRVTMETAIAMAELQLRGEALAS